jgi:hypothetical protein
MRKERLNPGDIPRSLMQSLICKRTVRFERPVNRMRFSFTTVVLSHEETYRDFGFELVSVERGTLAERISIIKAAIR